MDYSTEEGLTLVDVVEAMEIDREFRQRVLDLYTEHFAGMHHSMQ